MGRMQRYLDMVAASKLLAPNLKTMTLKMFTGRRNAGNDLARCVVSCVCVCVWRGPAPRAAPRCVCTPHCAALRVCRTAPRCAAHASRERVGLLSPRRAAGAPQAARVAAAAGGRPAARAL